MIAVRQCKLTGEMITEAKTHFDQDLVKKFDEGIPSMTPAGVTTNLAFFSSDLKMEKKQISGVVSSLVKKGILHAWISPDEAAYNNSKGQMLDISDEACEFIFANFS